MSIKNIRCRKCQEWNKWEGDLYACCNNCNSYIQEELIAEHEKKIKQEQLLNEKRKAAMEKESNLSSVVRTAKKIVNWLFMGVILLLILGAFLIVG